ncbi:hypothetical protein Psal006b_02531 [Piscirickettsia salmonis]|uniref:Uncharacterized protein n=2 Tax=Piscirickettsia salmonis TaxID=1238 RepID=A0A1L6T9K5_PISSA|nr:hypothetical protein [Piscirickettsia salmonis]ALB21866.1 hypothetical protein KU39_682 [Piscirickettsia salmonis]AMA41553.1 hypothetical protein AWJ11_03445 [Piscirickettsia salmonis]AOS34039.1 hypothetical protein AVM72_00680 [Piscirickettsia salmonis]APS61441.1 hypothetical protein AVI53_13380 [Piscirickettsia salmonis]APS64684.1 hypothetical protein AVI54_13370 [Piscirickettsia salmonis]
MRTATVTNLVIYIFTYLTYITNFFYYFFIHNTISYSRNIIYTWQDTQGILSFSNHAHPNATTLELPSPVTLSSNQITMYAQDTNPARSSLTITTTPSNHQTIHHASGRLTVTVRPKPGIQYYHYYIDGRLIKRSTQSSVTLHHLDRGQHQLKVIAANKLHTLTSNTLIFYLHRASILNSNLPNHH